MAARPTGSARITGSGAVAVSKLITLRHNSRPPELSLRASRRAVQAARPVMVNSTASS